ncbi:hypothetical protein [Microcystis phage Mae-JY24]
MIPRFVTVTLPPIPQELSPNHRCHYMAKARVTKKYRQDTCIAFKAAIREYRFERAKIHLQLYADTTKMRLCGGYAPKDRDNLIAAFKAGQDGIRDSGLIAGDEADRLMDPSVTILRGKAAGGRCELVVVVNEVVD